MGTLIITSALLALATAVFVAFWDKILECCVSIVAKVVKSFITLVKVSAKVCAYLYRRKQDGWYKQEIEVEKINVSDCPLSVRNALFDYNEVIVQRY